MQVSSAKAVRGLCRVTLTGTALVPGISRSVQDIAVYAPTTQISDAKLKVIWLPSSWRKEKR